MKQIKLYNKLGVFKDNIDLKLLIGDISFDNDVNAGQGTLNLNLALNYHTDLFLQGDIIEIREFNQSFPNGTPFYTGFIENITRTETNAGQQVMIKVVGLFQLLNNFIYKDGTNLTFTKNDTPANIIEDIINQFNTNYGVLNTTNGPESINSDKIIRYNKVQVGVGNINIEFDKKNMLNAIKDIQKSLESYFYIDNTGLLTFAEKRTVANKRLTFDSNILNIKQVDTQNELINKLHLERNGGVVKIYEDTNSQNTYGIKETYISNTDLQDETSQDNYGNTYIIENKDIKQQISITTNITTDIIPGDSIKTLNTANQIENLQVVKVNISPTQKVVYLDEFIGIGKTIINAK